MSSHLALIAWIHSTIWVTISTDFTLPQVASCPHFGVARVALTSVTTECVRTDVLARLVLTFVDICKEEEQVNHIIQNGGGN